MSTICTQAELKKSFLLSLKEAKTLGVPRERLTLSQDAYDFIHTLPQSEYVKTPVVEVSDITEAAYFIQSKTIWICRAGNWERTLLESELKEWHEKLEQLLG